MFNTNTEQAIIRAIQLLNQAAMVASNEKDVEDIGFVITFLNEALKELAYKNDRANQRPIRDLSKAIAI